MNIGNSQGENLLPGSLIKLFVAGAVLDHAGKSGDIDMSTIITHNGFIKEGTLLGDLYIIGRGNALLTSENLEAAAGDIFRKGIGKIEGDIVADDTIFDIRGIERERRSPAYAPPSALGLALHTVSVIVESSREGEAPKVKIEPPNSDVRFSILSQGFKVTCIFRTGFFDHKLGVVIK